ncbi:hypothetical protein I6A84_24980 [Frankia sp. CNm7]|uniref:Fido domain-containing protein n=1 Tax=Frankia nepalensis TaxID=1836974 RepID=A0A937RT15_9ACTN|nr:hypothetical protein [Frankia nepalensis]MBL7496247.1 hypothetical protein [Frankia nepalensis]MBL7515581.1 hypothetical protein [Frankia nepalensis]MBL7521253.1 hypothetical protein [Frankia nepalensis]MBL7632243.1 hypothetical protein [Frankia nepalensis]
MSSAPSTQAGIGTDPFARVAALPGVDEAVMAARSAVDALLRHRVLRRRSAEVTAEASLRSARASAALEGHGVDLETLRTRLTEAADGDAAPAADGDLAATLGAVRLYAELGSLTTAWERAPRQALARMHTLLGRGIVPDGALGRPRAAMAAADPLELGAAPGPAELSARLDGLVGLLVERTSAPAIVVSAIVHGELLALRPFGALDGMIARAAARLVLVGRGLDPKAVTATDVGHLEAGPGDGAAGAEVTAYRAAAAGYAHGGAEGLRGWLLHCARAVELGARESLAVCEAIGRA